MSDPDLTRNRTFSKRGRGWEPAGPFDFVGHIRLSLRNMTDGNDRLEENLRVLSPWRTGSNDISNYNGGGPLGYFVNDPWAEMYDEKHCDRCGEELRPWDFGTLCCKCEHDLYSGESDPRIAFQRSN